MHVFAAAFRTLDLLLFVFRKREDDFEWLVAIFAENFVRRHDDPPIELRKLILQRWEASYGGDENDAPKASGDITDTRRRITVQET